jgi:hypothetical protein
MRRIKSEVKGEHVRAEMRQQRIPQRVRRNWRQSKERDPAW